jgi:hypothetical protein
VHACAHARRSRRFCGVVFAGRPGPARHGRLDARPCSCPRSPLCRKVSLVPTGLRWRSRCQWAARESPAALALRRREITEDLRYFTGDYGALLRMEIAGDHGAGRRSTKPGPGPLSGAARRPCASRAQGRLSTALREAVEIRICRGAARQMSAAPGGGPLWDHWGSPARVGPVPGGERARRPTHCPLRCRRMKCRRPSCRRPSCRRPGVRRPSGRRIQCHRPGFRRIEVQPAQTPAVQIPETETPAD